MSDELALSVVIPCHNAADVLADELDALAAEPSGPWEVIVVDNRSTDSTIAVAERYAPRFDRFRVVPAAERLGRHYACNVGAAVANGRSLVFVDADDQVAPGFVGEMSRALEHEQVAVPRFDYRALNGDDARHFSYQTAGVATTDFLPAGSGSGFAIHRDLFERIGGFDETMTYCEDMDLSWRVVLAGVPLAFVPTAVLCPRQRSDLRSMFRQHFNFGIAMTRLFGKYRPLGMPRRARRETVGDWRMILTSAPRLRTADQKVRWVRRTGRALGRLWGSVRYRTLYL